MGRFGRFQLVAPALIVAAAACHTDATAPKPVQATLRIFPDGQKALSLSVSVSLQLPIALYTTDGSSLGPPPTFTLVSRDSTVVSAPNGAWVHALAATPSVWIVATALYHDQLLIDSVNAVVFCPPGIVVLLNPPSLSLAVGESATPTAAVWGCGRLNNDTFTWSAIDSTIVRVDAATGRTTGLRVGQTGVRPVGARYGSIGVIPVTVR